MADRNDPDGQEVINCEWSGDQLFYRHRHQRAAACSASIRDFAENGFVRYTRHPDLRVASKTTGLTFAVMKMTGTEMFAA
jgi:hypothetical protein